MFEFNFYQDQNKWKHNLIPIEISKNDSNRVVDILKYKTYYADIEKLNVFLGYHHKKFISRLLLNSYTGEKMLFEHKPKCETYEGTSTKTSCECHIYQKKTSP